MQKKKTARDRKYLDFVKQHPCCYCHGPNHDPHHFAGRKGTALRATDFLSVPLCRKHHDQVHGSSLRGSHRIENLTREQTEAMFFKCAALLLAEWAELKQEEIDELRGQRKGKTR